MIVDATPLQAIVIAKRMEPVLLAQARAHGIDPRREHLNLLQQSAISRAWIRGGRCLAIGGVIGTMLSSEGLIWLAFATEARQYPKMLLRNAALTLDEISMTYRRLTAYIDADNARDVRFAEYFGFRMGERFTHSGMAFLTAVREMQ